MKVIKSQLEYTLVRAIMDERFREALFKDSDFLCKREGIEPKVAAIVSDIGEENLKAFSVKLSENVLKAASDIIFCDIEH